MKPQRRYVLVSVVLLLFMVLGFVFHALVLLIPSPTMTITLTTSPRLEEDNYQIFAVLGHADPAHKEIQARLLTAISNTRSTTVSLAGHHASGEIDFVNQSTAPITLQSTLLRSRSGVLITFNGPVTIPAGFPGYTQIPGFAVNPGTSGNIPQDAILGGCCVPDVIGTNNDVVPALFARNIEAFSGGLDVQANGGGVVVEQSDIESAANPLLTQLGGDALAHLAQLARQRKSTEQVAKSSVLCQPHIRANHVVGDIAQTLTVTVSVTCTEQVYDAHAALTVATTLLRAEASSDAVRGIEGQVLAKVQPSGQVQVNVQDEVWKTRGQVEILIWMQNQGVWMFSPLLFQQFAQEMAGKSQSEARALLDEWNYFITDVQFSRSAGQLPTESRNIHFVVRSRPLSFVSVGP